MNLESRIEIKHIPIEKLKNANIYNKWTREYESRLKDVEMGKDGWCYLIIEKKGSYPFAETRQDDHLENGIPEHL